MICDHDFDARRAAVLQDHCPICLRAKLDAIREELRIALLYPTYASHAVAIWKITKIVDGDES